MPDHGAARSVELRRINEVVTDVYRANSNMEITGQEALERLDRSEIQNLNHRTIRKLDFILLPFLALLFLFNSLDRSNIGNAETANFTKDVGLDAEDLNTAVAVFFVFFVALQPIGAALGRKYGMAKWVPACMAIWGLCTCLHVWVRSKWQLIALRIVIGALEAGFYPTTVSYLSLFYTKYEFAKRLALFYGQYAVASALGGLVSYGVFSWFSHHGEPSSHGVRSWQVLFLLEGGVTIILALVGFIWLPHNAKTAWFLKLDERIWAEQRILRDRGGLNSLSLSRDANGREEEDNERQISDPNEAEGLLNNDVHVDIKRSSHRSATDDRGLSKEDVIEAVLDWKLWYLLICNILSAIPVTAFSVFLPLVLRPLTATPANANLLAAPPFLFGAIVLYCFTYWSDRSQERIIPILWSLGMLLFGLIGVVVIPSSFSKVRYMALCILLGGTFVASPLVIAWLVNNIPETGKRSIALGINGWGNLAGVVSSLLFQPRFAPSYTTPFFVTLALVLVAFIGFWVFRRLIIAENAQRQALINSWSNSEVAAEAKYGGGPLPAKPHPLIVNFARKFAGNWIHQHFAEHPRTTNRSGDARMTFQYGL